MPWAWIIASAIGGGYLAVSVDDKIEDLTEPPSPGTPWGFAIYGLAAFGVWALVSKLR